MVSFAEIRRKFVRAIYEDEDEVLTSILATVCAEWRGKLLTADVQTERQLDPERINFVEQLSGKAVFLSVLYQASRCFEVLLKYEYGDSETAGDRYSRIIDDHGNNMLHFFVSSYFHTKNHDILQMYDSFIKDKTADERNLLLQTKNSEGLTPIDLAAKLSCSKLFQLYLYTEGAHRHIESEYGKTVTNKFTFNSDTTDFLWQLCMMKNEEETSESLNEMVQLPVIDELIWRKFRRVLWIVIIWAAARIFVSGLAFEQEMHLWLNFHADACGSENYTTWLYGGVLNLSHQIRDHISSVSGLIIVIFDLFEMIYLICRNGENACSLFTNICEDVVVNTTFYRQVVFAQGVTMVIIWLIKFQDYTNSKILMELITVMFLLKLFFASFSMLYFIQILPKIGFFVIGFQKMLISILKFSILQIIIFLVFTTLFTYVELLFCKNMPCEDILDNYKTFLIMLNMEPVLQEQSSCSYPGSQLLKLLHVVYIFTVAVMVLNYMIAVMSSTYNELSCKRKTALPLHRLHICLVIERRIEMLQTFLPFKRSKARRSIELSVTEVCRDFDDVKHVRLAVIGADLMKSNTSLNLI